MFKVLRDWIQRYFSDEEAVVLAVLLFLAFTAVLTLGGMLAPVLAGMVLAYLMQGLVVILERLRLPGAAAVGLVFALFMGGAAGIHHRRGAIALASVDHAVQRIARHARQVAITAIAASRALSASGVG
ncbi:hypothetical protein F475_04695 [Pseudomonas sp. URMO17WK12:I6]|nr:hypothetical protein F475_04695 [Pseudomonas sp. URMO17WK12:I6]